ncbi:MAG: 30S ribosomal protein S4 [Planctomycetes bacterium]|nr:30S ribosomal protein S4 [Planctomycetota bacterium]
MARYTGPRLRKLRRLGIYLPGLTRKPLKTRTGAPGQHAHARTRISDYGIRLREKQRLRVNYGLGERQLRRLFDRAKKMKGDTGVNLLMLAESRLDNVVFRSNFAPTIPAARQLVNHGHVLVNDKKVDIASFRVNPGDNITLRDKAKQSLTVQEGQKEFMRFAPTYLEVEKDEVRAVVVGRPTPEDLMLEIDVNLIIEFYSH